MNSLSGIGNLPTVRYLDPTGSVIGGGRRAPASADPAIERRARYGVYYAYRCYHRSRAATTPRDAVGSRSGLRKFSSADLLDTMIHQMGGGLTPSAKGTFVDIAV